MTEPPVIVVRGRASAEEVAAITAVLLSRAAAGPAVPGPRSRWADRAGGQRRPLLNGPGAWRSAGKLRGALR